MGGILSVNILILRSHTLETKLSSKSKSNDVSCDVEQDATDEISGTEDLQLFCHKSQHKWWAQLSQRQ